MAYQNECCLWYCKSTIFQANHNLNYRAQGKTKAVCDTAKVRFFKQITTYRHVVSRLIGLFVILQKYDFSSKSQPIWFLLLVILRCLWYCKSTIFQANHNTWRSCLRGWSVVCDTAKARFFKQITTIFSNNNLRFMLKSSWLLMVRWIGWSLFSLCGKTKINILLMHKVLDEDTIKTWNIAPSCLWQNVFVYQKATWRKLFHVFSTS